MFVVSSNKPGRAVYGLFETESQARNWARHHLVGFCWVVHEVCHV